MLIKMEEIHLTETEQRYFGDLFVCCDSDNSGKIPVCKASELFRTANLPLDVVKQITELSGGGAASHFGRQQFYLALKLIAAFQAGLPLQPETFHSSFDVPLPRFTWATTLDKWEPQHINRQQGSPDLIQLSDTDQAPTPQCEPVTTSPSGEVEVELRTELHPNGGSFTPSSGPGPKGTSPEASSTASDSPTPTNSVQERNWAVTTHWHGLVCEEQRQLLGTEEESSDRHSSDEEGDTDGDVWTITEEQREYYSAQFRSLQPDPSALIAGPVARLFFEKSRLPVQELRKIWQLADVTKDGALSLDEFNTAMHLVVLRRNNIDLPDSLPPSLVPPHQCQPATVVPVEPSVKEGSPPSISPSTGEPSSPPRSKEWTKFVDSPTSSVSSPGPKPVNFDFHKSAVEQDPKILHPVPLRLTPESQSLPPAEEEACRSPRKLTEGQQIPYEQLSIEAGSPKKGAVPSLAVVENNVPTASEIRPIQRPQPKKHTAPGPGAIPPPPQPGTLTTPDDVSVSVTASTTASTQSGPTSLPMPVTTPQIGPKKEPPPPPPPRPYRTHARSSSLDLNRLGKSGSLLGAPPVVPPRVSPSTTSPKKLNGQRSEGDVLALTGDAASFADFAQFGQDEESCGDGSQPRRHGAFEVYRKPSNRTGALEVGANVQQLDSPEKEPEDHKHPDTNTTRCSDSLHQLQEQNSLLIRICQELNQELAEVQEERASLELKLEQLKAQMTD